MTTISTPTADEPYTTDEPTATQFHDMHSGGTTKTSYDHIFVELPEDKAIEWFKGFFGQDPGDVACQCCGPNFSVTESPDLRQATAYERRCQFVNVTGESGGGHYIEEDRERFGRTHERIPYEEYIENADDVLFIREDSL